MVPRYGAVGAAWGWVLLNAGYLLVGAQFLYKRTLPLEKWHWYWQDVALPIVAAGLTAFATKWLIPTPAGHIGQTFLLLTSAALIFLSAVVAASYVKNQFSLSIMKAINVAFSHTR